MYCMRMSRPGGETALVGSPRLACSTAEVYTIPQRAMLFNDYNHFTI